jgi:membrane protein implicated in regulation of membrane protease activity
MEPWVLWIAAGCVLAVGEMLTLSFFLAPFAGGAFLAGIAAAVGAGPAVSLVVFIVASTLLLTVARPIARSHRRMPAALRTGTAALIGRPAVVIERIANDEGVGCVKIDGEIWTARAFDEQSVIQPGTRVEVLEIRGATALVSE